MANLDNVPAHSALSETSDEILRRRAESLAREATEEEASDRQSLLLFRLSDEWYAVRVDEVREIFQEYSITPVPGVPDYILGVVNVRGEILSVTDPARIMRLGQIDLETGENPPAIVIVSEDVVTALVVDEIGDIAEVANDSIEPPVSIIDRQQAEFISGSVYVGGSMVGLVSVDKMLEPVVAGGRH